MSYCRFTEADIYLYWSVADSGGPAHVACCACPLMPLRESGFHQWYRAETFTDALEHVAQHRAAGHDVPEYVDEELREDLRLYGDDPTRSEPL